MKLINTIALLLLILFSSTALSAQEFTGEDLEIRLFIIGQGDPVYSSWGHTGIAIKNKLTDRDVFFDFGNFYFEDEDFFKNFAIGRLLYIASAAYTKHYIQSVIYENRDLTEYVLNISPEKKLEMYNALRTKSLPENRTYLYHNYNDNCSTRIRDYIDDATMGQLKSSTDVYRDRSFRSSFLLYTSHIKSFGSALSLLQGPPIDKEISIWQEMFIPAIMGEIISSFQYKDYNENMVPLVLEKRVLNKASGRAIVPDEYERPYIQIITISLFLSLLILYLNFRAEKGKIRGFASANILIGLFIGILGSVLLFLAAFTDHNYSYGNLNLFMINPIALFLIPAGIMYWKKGSKWKKKIDILWLIQIASTLVMVLIKLLTPVKQDNLLEIILFLPILISFSPLFPYLAKEKRSIGAIL